MGARLALAALAAALAAAGAGTAAVRPAGLAGTWRIYSAKLYYAAGGGMNMPLTSRELQLEASGRWEFGTSTGTWSVVPIRATDWKRWGVSPYGPKRKIVLARWSGGTGDGPLEESTRIDFVWVIYRARPPAVPAPGTVWLKFGRPNP